MRTKGALNKPKTMTVTVNDITTRLRGDAVIPVDVKFWNNLVNPPVPKTTPAANENEPKVQVKVTA